MPSTNSHNRTTIIPISSNSGITNSPLVTYQFSTISNIDQSNSPPNNSNPLNFNPNPSNSVSFDTSTNYPNTTLNSSSNPLNNKNARCFSPLQMTNRSRLNKKTYNRTRADNITSLYEQQVVFFINLYLFLLNGCLSKIP